MGAETSSTHLIFFIVAMILAASVASIVYSNFHAVTNAAYEGGNTLSGQLKTDITIINDPSIIPHPSGNIYTFYVKNTGTSILAKDLVNVIIDGIMIPDASVNKTVAGGSTTWRPTDVLQLNVTYAMNGDYTIKVITENGVSDSFDFVIP